MKPELHIARAEQRTVTGLLSVQDVADLLKVSRKTVLDWCHKGRLQFINPPGTRVYRFRPQDVQQFIDVYRQGGQDLERHLRLAGVGE